MTVLKDVESMMTKEEIVEAKRAHEIEKLCLAVEAYSGFNQVSISVELAETVSSVLKAALMIREEFCDPSGKTPGVEAFDKAIGVAPTGETRPFIDTFIERWIKNAGIRNEAGNE